MTSYNTSMQSPVDLARLMAAGLPVRMEPVVSVRQKAVIGHEARLAGTADGLTGAELRALAAGQNLAVEFDRAFRRAALEAFAQLPGERGLCFLAFESAVLDQGVAGSGKVAAAVEELGLTPPEVVLSVRESRVEDGAALKRFVDQYRERGFLIALESLGDGNSNLERIAVLRPDILKLGEGLVGRLDGDFFQQQIVKSLSALSHKLGALVVAEGVATENQALAALDLGVDMLQGDLCRPEDWQGLIARLAAGHKAYSVEKAKAAEKKMRGFESLMGPWLKDLATLTPVRFEEALRGFVAGQPTVECLFILDSEGVQETDTVAPPTTVFKPSPLFHPARRGADHSLKEYFYILTDDSFVRRFRTDPYVSLASGNLCVTLSALFRDAANVSHVLCVDVPWR